MKALVGLGNPGAEYERTRHNLGFLVAETFAGRRGVTRFREDGPMLVARTSFAGEDVIVVKPQTFMNRSGAAVRLLTRKHASRDQDLIVAHDELDLELGDVRIKLGGGHGGHNGLRSILAEGDAGEFVRVRMGIAREPGVDAAEWVLQGFSAGERVEAKKMVERAADAVEAVLLEGADRAMNSFNRRKDAAKPKADGAARGASGGQPE